jgi:hypothetical protein
MRDTAQAERVRFYGLTNAVWSSGQELAHKEAANEAVEKEPFTCRTAANSPMVWHLILTRRKFRNAEVCTLSSRGVCQRIRDAAADVTFPIKT